MIGGRVFVRGIALHHTAPTVAPRARWPDSRGFAFLSPAPPAPRMLPGMLCKSRDCKKKKKRRGWRGWMGKEEEQVEQMDDG